MALKSVLSDSVHPSTGFFFEIFLAILGPLYVHLNSRICHFSTKNCKNSTMITLDVDSFAGSGELISHPFNVMISDSSNP